MAGPADASIRKLIDIPAESLGTALKSLARTEDIDVMFASDDVAELHTSGLTGNFTLDEALSKLLVGTGLTYRYLGTNTVSVMPADSQLSIGTSGLPQQDDRMDARGAQGKSLWDRFQVAQVDQGTRTSPASVSMNEPNSSAGKLEEIVVTAQKREQRVQDVPMSISVLSGNYLDQSGSTGVLEELSRVPGVVINTTSQTSLMLAIRGVSAPSFIGVGASPIAFYLDTAPFSFVRNAYVPDLNDFDLQRVEVLRGPQGTLYGAAAENGVVRVLPNEADPSAFDLKVRALGSDTDGGRANGEGDLAINVPLIENQLAVRAVVGYQYQSGWIDRPDDKDANAERKQNYRLKITYRPLDALTIDLSYWGSRDHFDSPSNSLLDRTAPKSGTTPEPYDADFDTYGAKLIYEFSHVSVTSMTSNIDFCAPEQEDYSPFGGFFTGLYAQAFQKMHGLSEEFLLNSKELGSWHWTAGAYYRDEREQYWQIVFPYNIGILSYSDASKAYAVFGEFGRRFLDDQFDWTVGVRQFHDDVSHETLPPVAPLYAESVSRATTPRAVLSWFPNKSITVYSSFSEGFRSGFPQQYQALQIDPNLAPVKPDKLYNFELGTKGDFLQHRLAIDASVYYVDWRDVQQQISVPYQGGGINAVVNGQSASGPGVDLAVSVHPIDRLQVGGTFSWNDLTVDSDVVSGGLLLFRNGGRLNNSSEYTGGLFATYDIPLGTSASGELSVSGNYTSEQVARSITPLKTVDETHGDNLFFLRAGFTVNFRNNWSMKLFGENLTNEYGALQRISVVGYAPTLAEFTQRPRPRTVGVEVDYRYR